MVTLQAVFGVKLVGGPEKDPSVVLLLTLTTSPQFRARAGDMRDKISV